jgi:hypothetical protein
MIWLTIHQAEAAPLAFALQPLPLWQKALCGLTAGGLGALVGSPADLSLIRMQARKGNRRELHRCTGALACSTAMSNEQVRPCLFLGLR